MKTQPPCAVWFDSDDLLTSTYNAKLALYQALGLMLDPPVRVTNATLRRLWGQPIPRIMRGLYGEDSDLEALEDLRAQIEASYPVAAIPDAASTLKTLCAAGMPLGIVSSTSSQYLLPGLEQAGIDTSQFLVIQGGGGRSHRRSQTRRRRLRTHSSGVRKPWAHQPHHLRGRRTYRLAGRPSGRARVRGRHLGSHQPQ